MSKNHQICIIDYVITESKVVFYHVLIVHCFYSQKMRYVAAYLLAVLGGNNNPGKQDITKILESIGLDIDDERLDKVRDFGRA